VVEHFLGKEEVVSSILINGSIPVLLAAFSRKYSCSGKGGKMELPMLIT
jgi:hypothetical protein